MLGNEVFAPPTAGTAMSPYFFDPLLMRSFSTVAVAFTPKHLIGTGVWTFVN